MPGVLDLGVDDQGTWLVTAALPGEPSCSDRWKAEPVRAVTAIGEAIRQLHDGLQVDACPFSWSIGVRAAEARRRAAGGLIDPETWFPEHRRLSVEAALDFIAEPPSEEELVVCHGDACAPNTILADDGHCSGHVDLGWLGTADRWADLAVGSWSIGWNFGPELEDLYFEAYGVERDADRIRYYCCGSSVRDVSWWREPAPPGATDAGLHADDHR